jgi:hypothetical protein
VPRRSEPIKAPRSEPLALGRVMDIMARQPAAGL